MHQVTIHQAKTTLSKLIQECLTGETVVIAKGKAPLVKLMPLHGAKCQRRIGGARGIVEAMAADFDAPLDDFKEYMP
jgi:antitoxin (DNA-binding transcriptional repressor) of toxin-antitoxin stability system